MATPNLVGMISVRKTITNQLPSRKTKATTAVRMLSDKSQPNPLELLLISNFYPSVERLGPHATGMVTLLAETIGVKSIEVLSPNSCRLPTLDTGGKIRLETSWAFDDPLSLVRTLAQVLAKTRAQGPGVVVLFNLYPTAFGKSRVANTFGMLLPTAVRILSRNRVWVYAHNLSATQDLGQLGYKKGRLPRLIAYFLELLLLSFTDVVVPLESQRERIENKYHRRAKVRFIPYVEAVYGYLSAAGGPSQTTYFRAPANIGTDDGPVRLLLFGSWGPQKDFDSVASALAALESLGVELHLIVAGSLNRSFDWTAERVNRAFERISPKSLTVVESPPDESTPGLFRGADLLILPYNATGGASGVMNVGAFYGVPMIAFDAPQLRELSRLLNCRVKFVPRNDASALMDAIMVAIADKEGVSRESQIDVRLSAARTGAQRLAELLLS